MKNSSFKLVSWLILLTLVTGFFVPAASRVDSASMRVQPLLASMAISDPSETVRVIVQKAAGTSDAEQEVARLGGKVTRDLSLINAFAAEMTAGSAAQLSPLEPVRWVSLDAPVEQAGLPNKFSNWATATGRIVTNGFTSATNMLSAAGPNGTYGYGAAV